MKDLEYGLQKDLLIIKQFNAIDVKIIIILKGQCGILQHILISKTIKC